MLVSVRVTQLYLHSLHNCCIFVRFFTLFVCLYVCPFIYLTRICTKLHHCFVFISFPLSFHLPACLSVILSLSPFLSLSLSSRQGSRSEVSAMHVSGSIWTVNIGRSAKCGINTRLPPRAAPDCAPLCTFHYVLYACFTLFRVCLRAPGRENVNSVSRIG